MDTMSFTYNKILELFNYSCFYCGGKEDLEIDHIHPRTKGGKDKITNYVASCLKCNRKKWAYTLPKSLRNKAFSAALRNHFIIRDEINVIKTQELIDKETELNNKPVGTVVSIRQVDSDLWWQAKALASSKHISIRQLILDLLRQAVKEG